MANNWQKEKDGDVPSDVDLDAAAALFQGAKADALDLIKILHERKALAEALKEASKDALKKLGEALKTYGPAVVKGFAAIATDGKVKL